ncbi:thioredoxin-disulfide reductase [Hujiaoplasma nucleasis]|uniref:Thioredoxin reductase n=1 Tax=Hujiaoplasma nucleasis TaxID=2725268 RepID=A0A7L6N4Q2_9MOLU|nr:thioredoxin-disulfide reductase [Hujiaoplasma nucleasis]QLY39484.1 thioredoxin-disulfide reductase [Hujiaoplasma nucleasis]
MENILDVVIIGAGPGGLSAAIYAKRAMLNFVILEKFLPGGGIANTFELENYLGVGRVTGLEMSDMMLNHVHALDIEIQSEEVREVEFKEELKTVVTNKHTYKTKNIVIATGASPRKLGCEGEERLFGRGVSNCATCDGFIYKNKNVMVVGGGDVAVEDALYLSRMVNKVYLVHRRDELRAVKSLQDRLFKIENVEILWNHELKEIQGEDFVERALIYNNKSNEEKIISVEGIFIAVGYNPNIDYLGDGLDQTPQGWIKTNQNCESSIKGVYAIGDIRDTILRQVVTAVSDGAIAISDISKNL